jgi:hypothetical protein
MRWRAPLVAAALAGALGACGARADQPSPANVSVQVLSRDSTGVRFRVCNNGFQPIARVEFDVGGEAFTSDTLLDQAHCAETTRSEDAALTDTSRVTVTRVVGR